MDTAIPLFATAADRAAVRSRALAAQEGLDPQAWLWLAWTEREVDPEASCAMAHRVRLALEHGWQAPTGTLERLQLLTLDHGMRSGRNEEAEAQLPLLLKELERIGNPAMEADAHLFLSQLHERRGANDLKRSHLEAALGQALALGDHQRRLQFEADQARTECFVDVAQAAAAWRARLPADVKGLSSVEGAAIADFWGVLHGLRAEYSDCLPWLRLNYELSVDSGQIRRAIAAASNLGFILGQMNDHEEALQWLQKGLSIARRAGWPGLLGGLLLNTASVLHQLRQLDAARETLAETFATLSKLPPGRNLCIAYNTLGRVELEAGQPAAALAAFEAMQALPSALSADLIVIGGIGLAKALLALKRFNEGLERITATLDLARAQSNRQYVVEALGVRADLLAAQAHADAPAVYDEALAAAASLKDYRPEASLVEAAARAHAQAGDLHRAYALSCEANAIRLSNFSTETAKALTGLRAQHQIERTETDNRLLRERADMEAGRAGLLEAHLQLLMRLSAIGQEIATAIETSRVHEVLAQQVRQLLLPGALAFAAPDAQGEYLVTRFSHCDDGPLELVPLHLASSEDPRAIAQREARELAVAEPGEPARALHMPLAVGACCYGVLSVWSVEDRAMLGEREALILRMLATYGAIALANAEAYEQLSSMQQRLMQQERHRALGAMVAGVAHELNTPIGNALLMATTLSSQIQVFEQRIDGAEPLRRSELKSTMAGQREGLLVIERGMHTAARLVGTFKQVAVDRTAETRSRFQLQQLCRDCETTLELELRKADVSLTCMVPPDITLDSYPGALAQILGILLNNALLHAFEGPRMALVRRIELTATESPSGVRLEVRDNGIGLSQTQQRRVFEPFFTTKFGRGGSGLGLSIALNITENLLGGSMQLESQLQVGSCFSLLLPLQAPSS